LFGFPLIYFPIQVGQNHFFLERLDEVTSAPGWPSVITRPSNVIFPPNVPVPSPPHPSEVAATTSLPAETLALYSRVASTVAETLIKSKDELNALDAATGDGDCGLTLERGARQVLQLLSSNDARLKQDTFSYLIAIAEAISLSMGGTSGALLEIFFRSMARSLRDASGVPDSLTWISAVSAGVESLEFYGGAKAGHRTMLDAWIPAVAALKDGRGIQKAAEEAKKGSENTKQMAALAGRSNYVPSSQTQGIPDPGAVAVAQALAAVALVL